MRSLGAITATLRNYQEMNSPKMFCVIGGRWDNRLFHIELREIQVAFEKITLWEMFCVIDYAELSQWPENKSSGFFGIRNSFARGGECRMAQERNRNWEPLESSRRRPRQNWNRRSRISHSKGNHNLTLFFWRCGNHPHPHKMRKLRPKLRPRRIWIAWIQKYCKSVEERKLRPWSEFPPQQNSDHAPS